MQISTLRPGLMVHVSSTIKGNVSYATNEIETDHLTPEGARRARWETERTISDPEEHERATRVRSLARSKIQSVCIQSNAFGLSCPADKEAELETAIAAAEAMTTEFNSTASITRVAIYVAVGRVAEDDARAIRAINNEVRELMEAMQRGLANLDVTNVQATVEAVREAANKARNVGKMLSPEAQERVAEAVEAARKTARQMVKAGEQGIVEIDRETIRRIEQCRTSFLDLDDQGEISEPAQVSRSIDFAPAAAIECAPAQARMFDM